jgi:hypothetical protein
MDVRDNKSDLRRNHMRQLTPFVCLCCWVGIAHGQLSHGTVVVLSVSENRAIVAADSRGLTDGDPPNDHICKIAALGEHLLFTEAGVDGEVHTVLTSFNWSVQDEAVRAFLAVQHIRPAVSPGRMTSAVIAAWAKRAKRRYEDSEKRIYEDLLSLPTNLLLDAIFVGSFGGKLEVQEVSITFDKELLKKHHFAPVMISKPQAWTITSEVNLRATGHREIADEFSGETSLRAKQEALRWNVQMFGKSSTDIETLKLQHLIDLSITYAPYEWGIGGAVDEVELTPGTNVNWIHRKTECPENSAAVGPQSKALK